MSAPHEPVGVIVEEEPKVEETKEVEIASSKQLSTAVHG